MMSEASVRAELPGAQVVVHNTPANCSNDDRCPTGIADYRFLGRKAFSNRYYAALLIVVSVVEEVLVLLGLKRGFIVLGVFGLASVVSAAEYKLVEDFESGKMSIGTLYNQSGNAPVVSTDVARSGRYSMKTFLDRLNSTSSYRTEISLKNNTTLRTVQFGEDMWYGFSIFLPNSYVSSPIWEIVAQWHDIPNDWTKGRGNPPMILGTRNGVWRLTNAWDSDPVGADGSFRIDGKKDWYFGEYERNKWTDWVFHIKWSYGQDGILQVWKDGKLVAERRGPNTYNDNVGPYMKIGMYKGWKNRYEPPDTVGTRLLYHDEIRIAGQGATYADVAPGGGGDIPEAPVLADD